MSSAPNEGLSCWEPAIGNITLKPCPTPTASVELNTERRDPYCQWGLFSGTTLMNVSLPQLWQILGFSNPAYTILQVSHEKNVRFSYSFRLTVEEAIGTRSLSPAAWIYSPSLSTHSDAQGRVHRPSSAGAHPRLPPHGSDELVELGLASDRIRWNGVPPARHLMR